jgi:hypothetical protein
VGTRVWSLAGWEGWISLGTDPATGKRRRRHVRGGTKAEVDEKIKAPLD